MRLRKAKRNINNQDFQNQKNIEKNEKEKEESQNIINNNNKIIETEDPEKINMPKPEQNFLYKKPEIDINKKNKLYEMLEIEYDKIYYRLFFYINDDNNLVIELIPKDGYLPYSYKNIFDEKTFYSIDKIFMELKTVDKIGEKIINLFKKDKVLLGKNKREEIFYLILKITIIDEDKDIFIPLNKNDNIQICTINYLLKESERLKNDFSEYKDETEDIIKQQLDEINGLKKTNKIYLKIIKKIKNEYDKKNKNINNRFDDSLNSIHNDENEDDEINNNKIIINKEKIKDKDKNSESDLSDEEINKISETIVDQSEQYNNIKNKVTKMEKELHNLTKNYKCDINSKNKILNISIKNVKPFSFISFELTNTGINCLSSKYDDIFCNIEGITPGFISFYDEKEKYISLHEPLLSNKKITISKKIIINNPSPNRKYDFYLNIYTLNHGRISEQPIKFQICIRENDEQKNFISFLRNKKWGFDYKNKNKKIILEYTQNLEKIENNKLDKINVNRINYINDINYVDYENRNKYIRIRKYVYDSKSGKAFEKDDEDEDDENNELDKIDKYFTNLEMPMNIVIDKDDIDKIINKIHTKFKNSFYLDRFKLEDIICNCVGDFDKISNTIRSII